MIEALTLILLCQLAGEVLVGAFELPVPGPVLGMLLLLGWLFIRGGVDANVESTTSGLLGHFSLLFVPAGVGVMVHWESIRAGWLALAVALVVSTVIGLVVTALVMQGLRAMGKSSGDVDERTLD